MKRIIYLSAVMVFFLFRLLLPVYAADVSVGMQVWYAWWEPAWGNTEYTADPSITVSKSSSFFNPDASFMIGPLFSVTFYGKWSLSLSGAYGEYSARGTRQPVDSILVFEEMDIRKYDVDSAFSIILNRYVKIFAGLKIQGYDYDKKLHQLREGNPPSYQWEQYKETSYRSLGPGAGVGFSYPLGERLFAIMNINALMLFAFEDTDMVKYIFNPVISIEKYSYEGRASLFGGNGALSLGYLVPESRLTFTAGIRYQAMYYKQNKSDAGEYYFDGKTDMFYGITMSVIYSFNTGS